MKMKKFTNILLSTVLISALFGVVFTVFSPQMAVAADGKCAGVDVSYLDALCDGGDGSSGEIEDSGLWQILTGVLNIMVAGVGVLAVAGMVYGAILYSSAADNQSQVEQAMTVFRNVVIGLVTFALMYSILQFLIPGGIF